MGSMTNYCPLELSYKDLELYTNSFSDENFIGKTQFGSVYRGIIPQHSYGNGMKVQMVTIKIWNNHNDNRGRLQDEVFLLRNEILNSHPTLVKLIGYCDEGERLGVVYKLSSMNTMHNLIFKGHVWWHDRIKVAIGVARLLEFLHALKSPHPCIIRNIDAAHIMLDGRYNPKIIDFGMMSGGFLPDISNRQHKDVPKVAGLCSHKD